MCGIVGIYNLDRQCVESAVVRGMMALQRHRGPDDSGLRLFTLHGNRPLSVEPEGLARNLPHCEGAIGFNRLSILDCSANGHQPMVNARGTILLVFNGEIYNAFDYREQLAGQRGCVFRSRTDTEVLLYLYQEYGLEGMVERINGMYAICVADLERGMLHLVRDRMGIKPLYYTRQGQTLLFASEAKSFLAWPDFRADVDVGNLDEFLVFRSCAADRTLLKGVQSLLPGQVLTVDHGQIAKRFYWRLPMDGRRPVRTAVEAEERIEQSLRSSVKRQLLSDVELGCQFSGGIDSSLVTLMGSEQAGKSLHAISITLEDPDYSEERYMDWAAARCDVQCHKYTLDASMFAETLLAATWHRDHPISHPNAIGLLLLAKHAREWMTVLLSGEGADELLGGYPRYAYGASRWRGVLGVAESFGVVPASVRRRIAGRLGWDARRSREDWFIASSAFMAPDTLLQLRPEADMDEQIVKRRVLFPEDQRDFMKACLAFDMKTYLVDLLVRQDKMTMAHSVENRVPFLDNEMLDLWADLDSSLLVRPGLTGASRKTKMPLKRIAARHFGAEFAYRPKSGFSLPLRAFFEAPGCGLLMEEIVFPGLRRHGFVNAGYVETWWKRRSSFSRLDAEMFFELIALELWAYLFVDGAWKRHFPETAEVRG